MSLLLLGAWCISRAPASADIWSTGYYPGYEQSAMPASQVDFAALTHVIHFSVWPKADGSLNKTINGITPTTSADLISRAHAAGKKVLFSVSGSTSGGFGGATTNANQATFITNLCNFMSTYGYDGIDIDWEPLASSDALQYTNFIIELRTALNTYSPYRMLTVATAEQPSWFNKLQGQFDQINLMTYDLSGPWGGWVTWFNAPIYDGGYRFASTGGLVPSADGMVTKFVNAGVASGKLGIGIAFYGRMWSGGDGTSTGGVSAPRQSWTTDPTLTYASFATIMSTYYATNLYHWDAAAQSSYLGIDNTGSTNDHFISYDDEHACQAKVIYARSRGIGGIMIWELGEGYRSSQPAGQRDPLLQAVKRTLFGPNIWAGGGSNQNWSTSANWSNGVPIATADVCFLTNAAAATQGTVNNIVAANTTIQSLTCLNTNQALFHDMQINAGVTLTITNAAATNAIFYGSVAAMAATTTPVNTISGSSGTLVVKTTNGFVNVRQGGTNNLSGMNTLDMAGLGRFNADVSAIYVAGDGSSAAERQRASDTLKLARTNLLVLRATSGTPLLIGSSTGNGGSGGTVVLGLTNAIFCDGGIGVGLARCSDSKLNFGSSGSYAWFRNLAGTGRQNSWLIGDGSATTYSGNLAQGTVDFSNGTVDAQVSQLVVGRNQNSGSGLAGSGGQGFLTLKAGTLDVNTVVIGYEMLDFGPAAKGVVNVDGTAQFIVNTSMQLGRFTAAVASNGVSSAILNIGTLSGNGSVTVAGNITTTTNAASANDSEIHIKNGGSLSVKGTIGPLSSLELSGATLTLDFGTASNPAGAVCTVSNLQTASPLTLNLLGSGLSLGRFPLIKYRALAGNGAADFTTVNWPSTIRGYLSNNVANSSIDVVIIPPPPPQLSACQRQGDGNFKLTFSGWAGVGYSVRASTNLAASASTWKILATNVFSSNPTNYIDLTATNHPNRYYLITIP
jgi:chitinase